MIKEVTSFYCPLCREAVDITLNLEIKARGINTGAGTTVTKLSVAGEGSTEHTCKRGPQDAK